MIVPSAIEAPLTPPPVLFSNGRPWEGIVVHFHEWHTPGATGTTVSDYHLLALHLFGTVYTTQRRNGRVMSMTVRAGNIVWHPDGVESSWKWDKRASVVFLRIPLMLLRQAAKHLQCATWVNRETAEHLEQRDVVVERIVGLLLEELKKPASYVQRHISQALSDALAFHLVERFHCEHVLPEKMPHGLSAQALARVRDYVEAHLHQQIELQQLADVANGSRFHFARSFKESTGDSPMVYVEQQRMSRAQMLILQGERSMFQIAGRVGYADPSYFTKRFRQHFGMTPTLYAKLLKANAGLSK